MARVEVPEAQSLTVEHSKQLLSLGIPRAVFIAPGHPGAIEQLPHLWDCSNCLLINLQHKVGSQIGTVIVLLALAEIAPFIWRLKTKQCRYLEGTDLVHIIHSKP